MITKQPSFICLDTIEISKEFAFLCVHTFITINDMRLLLCMCNTAFGSKLHFGSNVPQNEEKMILTVFGLLTPYLMCYPLAFSPRMAIIVI